MLNNFNFNDANDEYFIILLINVQNFWHHTMYQFDENFPPLAIFIIVVCQLLARIALTAEIYIPFQINHFNKGYFSLKKLKNTFFMKHKHIQARYSNQQPAVISVITRRKTAKSTPFSENVEERCH